jgi:hypothetical protein
MEPPATREDDMNAKRKTIASIIADARANQSIHRIEAGDPKALAEAIVSVASDADFAAGLPGEAVEVWSLDPAASWRIIIALA